MQCYTVEENEEWGTILAFQIPKGTKASSVLFSYSLYLHAAFLFPEVYHFPVLLYSTVFTSTLEDKPATGATRVLYRGQEFVHITYHSYTLAFSAPWLYLAACSSQQTRIGTKPTAQEAMQSLPNRPTEKSS